MQALALFMQQKNLFRRVLLHAICGFVPGTVETLEQHLLLYVLFPLPRRTQLIVILKRATGIIGFLLLHMFISVLLPDVGHMLEMVFLSPKVKKKRKAENHPKQTPLSFPCLLAGILV